MKYTLGVITDGYLAGCNKTLPVVMNGYLNNCSTVAPVIIKPKRKGSSKTNVGQYIYQDIYNKEDYLIFDDILKREDEEILTIIKIFLKCQ